MKKVNLGIKRCFDVIMSLLCLIIALPFLAFGALGIAATMPGPILFRQERIGRDGKTFEILKLRSMKVDKEAEKNFDWSKDQERLTGFGKILRRTKIDELPQLVNVLKGDMSLVGPRPTIREQVEKYDEEQIRRLLMRPGMTGLAQVNGNVAISWDERISFDLKYIDGFNVFLDIKILFKTVAVVVWGEDKFVKGE